MSPSTLSLFPSPATSLPRKPSSKLATNDFASNVTAEANLRGVAFQIVTSNRKTAKVQPATDTFKHALFCEPSPSELGVDGSKKESAAVTQSSASSTPSSVLRRQSRTRRTSGPLTMSLPVEQDGGVESTTEEDSLSDLPQNVHFLSSTPPSRCISTRSRPKTPQGLSTIVQPDHTTVPVTPVEEKTDRLSPLPEKQRYTPPAVSSDLEYPPAYLSGSPSSSKGSRKPETRAVQMRSIFPTYDPSKPLDRQNYYPSPSSSPPPAYLGHNVSKLGSPVERQNTMRSDSAVGLLDGYEHVPAAAHGDMQALWKASCEEYPVAGRKVQFGLFQPTGNGKALAIGTSSEDLIYGMERDASSSQTRERAAVNQFAVRKHCPTARSSLPVSTLVIPDPTSGNSKSRSNKGSQESTVIFPHAAAMYAIKTVLDTPEACHIATLDPMAQSPEAAILAQDAVTEAHRRYCCDLTKRVRRRDSLGSVTAHYDLVHPMLGTFPVTVTKSLSAGSTSGPRAKISLHHPSATPAAVATDTLNLAFIDFAHNACVLDVPGLLALDSHYIIDTVISTLLAVAVIENDALVAETMFFEAPPQAPLTGESKKKQTKVARTSSLGLRRLGTKKAKNETPVAVVDEQVELGGVAKGVLAVMELAFKASAWVIVTGVKVGLGVVEHGMEKIHKRI